MNHKLTNYDDALKQLNLLEQRQRHYKKRRKKKYASSSVRKLFHKGYLDRKVHINLLLSIIVAHKLSRKLYGQVVDLERNLDLMEGIHGV